MSDAIDYRVILPSGEKMEDYASEEELIDAVARAGNPALAEIMRRDLIASDPQSKGRRGIARGFLRLVKS